MVRLSTTYDKDLKKKVFVVRGDEAYAKSTECAVTVGSITTGEVKGLKISSITINLYRTVGNAQLTLYDDDILLESWNISSSVHSKTLTNYYLGYGASHNLWAEYTPLNHQCLGCKSKKVTVSEEIPSSLLINYTKNSASSQVNSGADISFDYTVKKGSTNVANNTPVLVYVDDDYVKTVNTSSGKVASTISDIADGRHTIKLEVDTSDTFYGNSIEFDVLVGYQVEIYSYPQTFINDTDNTVVVNVMDYNGEPVTTGTVNIYKKNGSTSLGNASIVEGVATVTVDEIPSTGEYYASYGGSPSDYAVFTLYNPNGLTLGASSLLLGRGDTSNITVSLNDGKDGVPIDLMIGYTSTPITTSNGIATYEYTGTGTGDLTVTATVGEVTESINMIDSLTYWTSNTNHASNIDDVMDITDGSKIEYSNYIALRDITKTTGGTSGVSYGSIIFEPPSYPTSMKILQFTIAKKPSNVTSLEFKFAYGTGFFNVVPAITGDKLVIPLSKLNVGDVISFGNRKLMINDEIIYTFGIDQKFDPQNPYMNYIVPVLNFNTLNGGELYIKDLIYKKV